MKTLEQALNKINGIRKTQKKFIFILVQGLIGVTGKRNFRNMARFMELDEHTFSRQMAKFFDFTKLNLQLILNFKKTTAVWIAAQDDTFIPKSGKNTFGLNFFWNGSSSKVEKGLELDVIAVIKVDTDKKEAFTLSAKQTLSKKNITQEIITKIDFCIEHVKNVIEKLKALGVKYMVADAFFAKVTYVNGITKLGLHVISKFRKDARFRYLCTDKPKRRGRPKKYNDRKFSVDDFNEAEVIKIENDNIELRSLILYSIALKRNVKVVLVKKMDKNKYGQALLFSTDTQLDALNVYQFYVARFQIEFIFRDAKGFAGLADCQSQEATRLDFHFNASLLAVNIIRLQDAHLQQEQKVDRPFSIMNWHRQYYVEIVLNRFIAMFDLSRDVIKSHPDYQNMLGFGNVKY